MTIDPIIPDGYTEVLVRQDTMLTKQYEEVTHFYMLLVGEISFQITLSDPNMNLVIGESSETYVPVGWNGFNHPGRYTANVVVKSKVAQLLKWDLKELIKGIKEREDVDFLRFVAQKSYFHLKSAVLLNEKFNEPIKKKLPHSKSHYESPGASTKTIMRTFRRSPFLDVFTERQLRKLSELSEKRQFFPGEVIYEQDKPATGLYILAQGEVRLQRIKDKSKFYAFRSISTPGFVVGWTSVIQHENLLEARAGQETMIYYISQENLDFLISKDTPFGMAFFRRILWLIANQMQISQARIMSSKFNHEIFSVRHLIFHNRTKLQLSSPLHQVPHLLKHRDTTALAFETLHRINEEGKSHEKQIASLSLDLLDDTKRELNFYLGLQQVYETVSEAPEEDTAEVIRIKCSRKVQEVFEAVDYHLDGFENLPETPGHIFIYNHLLNDPSTTLPNDFQITLDSHFISSMILMKYYNDPGIRVVRYAKGAEFAHQHYYRKLGHINVFTTESDPPVLGVKETKQAREKFYDDSTKYLKSGINLIISPEGLSNTTNDSPGELKFGAFRLALMQEKEPLIVPITMAHFDKKVNTTPYLCQIQEPFKISKFVSSPNNKREVDEFLMSYRKQMKKDIQDLLKKHAPTTPQ